MESRVAPLSSGPDGGVEAESDHASLSTRVPGVKIFQQSRHTTRNR